EPRRTTRADTAALDVENASGNEPSPRYGWNSKIEVRFVCVLSLHDFLVELDPDHAADLYAFLRQFPLVPVLAQQRRLGVAHDALDGALDARLSDLAIVEAPAVMLGDAGDRRIGLAQQFREHEVFVVLGVGDLTVFLAL